jgi:hypothetical protein
MQEKMQKTIFFFHLSIFRIKLKGKYYIELVKKLSYLAKPKSPIFISGVADVVANSKFCMFSKNFIRNQGMNGIIDSNSQLR